VCVCVCVCVRARARLYEYLDLVKCIMKHKDAFPCESDLLEQGNDIYCCMSIASVRVALNLVYV